MLGKLLLVLAGCAALAATAPTSFPGSSDGPNNYNDMKVTAQVVTGMEEVVEETATLGVTNMDSTSHETEADYSNEDLDSNDTESSEDGVGFLAEAGSEEEDSDETELTASPDSPQAAWTPRAEGEIAETVQVSVSVYTDGVLAEKESHTYPSEEGDAEASGEPTHLPQ